MSSLTLHFLEAAIPALFDEGKRRFLGEKVAKI